MLASSLRMALWRSATGSSFTTQKVIFSLRNKAIKGCFWPRNRLRHLNMGRRSLFRIDISQMCLVWVWLCLNVRLCRGVLCVMIGIITLLMSQCCQRGCWRFTRDTLTIFMSCWEKCWGLKIAKGLTLWFWRSTWILEGILQAMEASIMKKSSCWDLSLGWNPPLRTVHLMPGPAIARLPPPEHHLSKMVLWHLLTLLLSELVPDHILWLIRQLVKLLQSAQISLNLQEKANTSLRDQLSLMVRLSWPQQKNMHQFQVKNHLLRSHQMRRIWMKIWLMRTLPLKSIGCHILKRWLSSRILLAQGETIPPITCKDWFNKRRRRIKASLMGLLTLV